VPFVLDASVSSAWAFDDEAHPDARAALIRIIDDGARVPWIWWFELRNVLIVNERRSRGSADATARFLRELTALSIEIESALDEDACLRLARRFKLTFYDAAYLELAIRERLPLATLDRALATAARAAGVLLVTDQ
jgi:predicted nucleic acid-binding protein